MQQTVEKVKHQKVTSAIYDANIGYDLRLSYSQENGKKNFKSVSGEAGGNGK